MRATDLLKTQHRTIAVLLSELRGERRSDVQRTLAAQAHAEMLAHVAAEEHAFLPAVQRRLDGACVEHARAARDALRAALERFATRGRGGFWGARQLRAIERDFHRYARAEEAQLLDVADRTVAEHELVALGLELRGAPPPVSSLIERPGARGTRIAGKGGTT